MKKIIIIIVTTLSIFMAIFFSGAFLFNVDKVIKEKGTGNISNLTNNFVSFIDNEIAYQYQDMENYLALQEEDQDDLITSLYEKKKQESIMYAGYIGNQVYVYNGEIGTKNFSFSKLSSERVLSQKVSILSLNQLFTDGSDDYVIFFTFAKDDITYFVIEDFAPLLNMMEGAFNDANSYFLIYSNDGILYMNTYNEDNSLQGVFDEDFESVEAFINDINDEDNHTKSYRFSSNRYLVTTAAMIENQNDYQLHLLVMVNDTYISSFSRPILFSGVIFVIFIIILFVLIVVGFLWNNITIKKRQVREAINSGLDDAHYIMRVNDKGKIISRNKKMNSLGYRLKDISSFAFVDDHDGRLIEDLPNIESLIIRYMDNTNKQILIKFLVIPQKNNYLFIGDEMPSEITIKEEKTDALEKDYAFKDDEYDVDNRKSLYYLIDEILNDQKKVYAKTNMLYFGIKNINELKKIYDNSYIQMIFASILINIKNTIKDVKLYNYDDLHFVFFVETGDDYRELEKIITSINKVCEQTFKNLTDDISLSLSFGVYNFMLFIQADKNSSPKKILAKVQKAYNKATTLSDKNYCLFDFGLEDIYQREINVINDIKLGLKNHEFETLYQPNYSLKEDRVTGFECLIRWNNPKYKFESPLFFVTIAEQNGLINDLGYFTLIESFKLIQELNDPSLHISVNVSPAQFLQKGFAYKLLSLYDEYHVSKSSICIEITETFLMDNLSDIIDKLNFLRNNGIKIYLDDFGTGYSSFLYLAELPVDVIKIDKEFVTPLQNRKSSRTIVTHIIQMANELKIETVAEGVEDAYQVDFLAKNGCTNIQGYYFSKPVKKADVKEALKLKRKKE